MSLALGALVLAFVVSLRDIKIGILEGLQAIVGEEGDVRNWVAVIFLW